MVRTSEKRHWDTFWSSSGQVEDIYANDGRIIEFLAERVDLRGKRVLEVGAGTGRDAAALAELGAEVWTLDYSEESLRLMRDNLGGSVRIVCGDALALPLAGGTFDGVYHQGLLEHFRDPGALLAENYRVLRPGGWLLVDVPQRFHYYTLIKHALMHFDKWFAGWETEFSPEQLRALVRGARFDVEAMYGCNLYPPVWYRGLRKVLLGRGLRLPMNLPGAARLAPLGRRLRAALPERVRLGTSMVIGCLGRKGRE